MPELEELMGDIPADLLGQDESVVETPPAPDDDDGGGTDEDDSNPTDEDDAGAGEEDDAGTEEDDDAGGTPPADEDDNDDYVTSLEDEEELAPAAPAAPATPQPPANDENSYILSKLNKIAVRVVLPGAKEGETLEKVVEVYGYGDLPRDYLGFASQYEAGVFNQAVIAQESKAQALQQEYRNGKMQADMSDYTRKENQAIAEDLTTLRQEGIFPKFKGVPGSKEFNESDGAKEFDKVVAYMNEQNRRYQRAANDGKSFRHIGFYEAFVMLNGPNVKAAERKEQEGRKAAAKRLASSRGTKSSDRKVSSEPVQNITDLQGEFERFAGAGANS